MRKGLLVLITAVQISSVAALRNTCDAKSNQRCDQMSESSEPEQDKMGQRLFKSAKEEPIFPQTLEEFGYEFVITDGQKRQMRHIATREPFKFEVEEGDRAFNQKHYEALGEVITEYVYKLLEEEVHLTKHFVPYIVDLYNLVEVDAKEDEEKSFIFMSDNAMTCDKLMILIHGSGVVRAGQWARRLIINDDLDCGTMLPYIKRATEEGYGVLITNGNENYVRKKKERRVYIRGSESPEKHFVYVWNNFISKAAAEAVVVVAHSYGGIVIVEGLQKCEGIMDKVKAVAFTDSVHSLAHQGATKKFLKWMRRNSRNWVSSDLPLNEPVTSLFKGRDCDMVSAGTVKHELTSHVAFESVFKFFDERLRASADESDNSEDQADMSKDQADMSKDQADTSKDQGDTSKDQAGTSKDQADMSKDQADTSKDQGDTSKDQGDTSIDEADTSKDQADTSKDQADTSIDEADTSKDQADTSKDQADMSKDQADTSKDQADTSKDQAVTSKDQADTSTSVTETTENKDSASSSQDIDMDSSQSQDDVSQMETDNTT